MRDVRRDIVRGATSQRSAIIELSFVLKVGCFRLLHRKVANTAVADEEQLHIGQHFWYTQIASIHFKIRSRPLDNTRGMRVIGHAGRTIFTLGLSQFHSFKLGLSQFYHTEGKRGQRVMQK